MPRWLLMPVGVLVFFPVCAAFAMFVWPLLMERPLPDAHSAEMLMIALAALLMSGFVATLLVADQARRRF